MLTCRACFTSQIGMLHRACRCCCRASQECGLGPFLTSRVNNIHQPENSRLQPHEPHATPPTTVSLINAVTLIHSVVRQSPSRSEKHMIQLASTHSVASSVETSGEEVGAPHGALAVARTFELWFDTKMARWTAIVSGSAAGHILLKICPFPCLPVVRLHSAIRYSHHECSPTQQRAHLR